MSQLFESGGQSIGVSASASVLLMNIQDRSPLGWTGWISLQSKGLSRVFSNTTAQKHQFFFHFHRVKFLVGMSQVPLKKLLFFLFFCFTSTEQFSHAIPGNEHQSRPQGKDSGCKFISDESHS